LNEQPQRVYADPWYAKNRSVVIERQHRRHLASVQRLTAAELARCQQDPTKAWTIRGAKWVACIEDGCGEVHKQLGPHLRVRHHLTSAEYKRKLSTDGTSPRYSKNASLTSLDLQALLSKKRKKLKLGRRLQDSGTVPPVKKLIASRGHRLLSRQFKIEQSRRKVGARPDLWGKFRGKIITARAADWEIAKLATEGASHRVISTSTGLGVTAVWWRLHRIGFLTRAHVYEHGEPLLGKHILAACQDFGTTRAHLADFMGLKQKTVCNRTYGASIGKPLPAQMGRELKVARQKLREGFRHKSAKGKDGGHPRLLTLSERASLPRIYRSLLNSVKAVTNWLSERTQRDSRVSFEELRQWVYSEARKGRLRRIAFWPDFFDWIQPRKDLHALLSKTPYVLTREFLAHVHGVSAWTIKEAMSARDKAKAEIKKA
jgi:predicted transcriptional regulator